MVGVRLINVWWVVYVMYGMILGAETMDTWHIELD